MQAKQKMTVDTISQTLKDAQEVNQKTAKN